MTLTKNSNDKVMLSLTSGFEFIDQISDSLIIAPLRVIKRTVVLAIGAGTAMPSVCRKGESLRGPLIRTNPAAATTDGT